MIRKFFTVANYHNAIKNLTKKNLGEKTAVTTVRRATADMVPTGVTLPTAVILPTVVATIRNSFIKTMIMLERTAEQALVVDWVTGFTAFGAMDVSKSMRLNLTVTTPGKTV